SGGSTAATTLPFVCLGLTQVINFAAELFVDPGTPVIVPRPRWGNYDQVLGMRRGANLVEADLFVDGEYSLAPLLKTLQQTDGPAMLVLNFPHNPSGFTPSARECAELVDAVLAHPGPLTVLVDDAYAGMMWGDDLPERSLFWELAERHDPERHVILRADGVTKELFFFPGRVGFLTAAIDPESPAAAALESKLGSLARSGNGSPPGPSQAAVLAALQDPTLEAQIAAGNAVLAHRWALLEAALDEASSPHLRPYPFNSGVFAMVGLADGVRADEARLRLIEEQDVGLVSIGAVNALRIAYCSVAAEDIVPLVHRLALGLAP
ncbi:MAG: aminotransferase class I/II-fold pyridoxal phosphate-dependent enzyme, partial [Myxococcota bacterium]